MGPYAASKRQRSRGTAESITASPADHRSNSTGTGASPWTGWLLVAAASRRRLTSLRSVAGDTTPRTFHDGCLGCRPQLFPTWQTRPALRLEGAVFSAGLTLCRSPSPSNGGAGAFLRTKSWPTRSVLWSGDETRSGRLTNILISGPLSGQPTDKVRRACIVMCGTSCCILSARTLGAMGAGRRDLRPLARSSCLGTEGLRLSPWLPKGCRLLAGEAWDVPDGRSIS